MSFPQHLARKHTLVATASVAVVGSVALFAMFGHARGMRVTATASHAPRRSASPRVTGAGPWTPGALPRSSYGATTADRAAILIGVNSATRPSMGVDSFRVTPAAATPPAATTPAGHPTSDGQVNDPPPSAQIPQQVVVTLPSYSGGRYPSVGAPRGNLGTPPSVHAGWTTTIDLGTPPKVTPGQVDTGSLGTINPPRVATR